MTIKEAFEKVIEEAVDLKYQLVVVATLLCWNGYMSDVTWSVFVLSVTGFRMADGIVDKMQELKQVAKPSDFFTESQKIMSSQSVENAKSKAAKIIKDKK